LIFETGRMGYLNLERNFKKGKEVVGVWYDVELECFFD
jgi:hypothetical protein